MRMKWRDSSNKIDCGVFLLRHMETYEGQLLEEWQAGIPTCVKNQEKVLNRLRVEFCAKILTHNVNQLREKVIEDAKKWKMELKSAGLDFND